MHPSLAASRARFTLTAALALLASACGAKTGLLVPDVHFADAVDAADVSDAFVRFDSCVAGRFTLQRRSAEVMLLLDRSGSMQTPLPNSGGHVLTRWQSVRDVLATTLPNIEHRVEVGAVFFPRTFDPVLPYSLQMCETRTNVDVAPAEGTSSAIVRIFRDTQPNGGTPTYQALTVAGRLLSANPDRALAKYILLATDGGPNCNSDLDATNCHCFSDTGSTHCGDDPTTGRLDCLDDDRTVDQITQLATNGIFTYVVGIYDPSEPVLSDVLDRMALAGGRPNTSGPQHYYNVERQQDLSDAFTGIADTIARCAYVTPSRPDDPDAIDVRVGGSDVPRDPQHMDGWDWTDASYGEITFYGAACSRAQEAGSVEAIVACRGG